MQLSIYEKNEMLREILNVGRGNKIEWTNAKKRNIEHI